MKIRRILTPVSRTRRVVSFVQLAALSSAALFLVACGEKKNAAAGPAAPQATEVGTVTLAPQAVTLTRDLPGRTSAYRVAEVRARVSGIVQKRLFQEGSEVKEGQALFQIDPAPYQAALDSARAQLARAEASAVSTKLQAERYKELLSANAISKQEYDNANASSLGSAADVAAAKAAVQTATINLDYTKVVSPISGRIGLAQVTEGAYVQQGAATLLATVQQVDRLYVDVNQASSEVLRLRKDLASGRLKTASEGKAQVKILLDDGTEYAEAGTLESADITVDPSTGSITVRALVPNPNRELLPGMFVRARLEEGVNSDALLVPQQGISRNQRGQATAMVVGADGKAELRVLVTERAIGNKWLVSSGVKAGEQVIVENLQRIRPGSPVKAVAPTTLAPATPVIQAK